MVEEFIIEYLVKQGMNEHLVLHVVDGKSALGNILYDKNSLYFKDSGVLNDIPPKNLKPCWDNGILGMITPSTNRPWESLTFLGLENCKLPVDLSATRHGALVSAENRYGDSLIDFDGSIYRGFKLMLQHHFLPVILLYQIKSTSSIDGLAVADLRMAPMPIKLIEQVNDMVEQLVEQRLCMGVEEANLDSGDFENLFGQYLQNA